MSSAALAGAGPGHQHRGAGQVVGAGLVLSVQSAAGLGSEPEPERLLAASSAVVLFRSPMPAELAALAGSERIHEGAWSFPGGTDVPPDWVTVTERHRARLDQDQVQVRAARVEEAQIIAAGRVERTRIIQTAIPAERIRASKRS
jgi:hypothetical protein